MISVLFVSFACIFVLTSGQQQCRRPQSIRNSVFSPAQGPYYPNTGVTVICNPGSILEGTGLIMCGADGRWVRPAQDPVCSKGRCQVPQRAQGASITNVGGTGTRDRPVSGTYFTYTCDSGCTFASGALTISCNNGNWVGQPPTCTCAGFNNNNGGNDGWRGSNQDRNGNGNGNGRDRNGRGWNRK